MIIIGALVDIGSIVNIISSELAERLRLDLEPAILTALKLANNPMIRPYDELKDIPITVVGGQTTQIDFYVMKMHAGSRG